MNTLMRMMILCGTVLVGVGCTRPYPNMRIGDATRIDDIDSAQGMGSDGIRFLKEEPTTGRFPSGITIARVTALAPAQLEDSVAQDETGEVAAQAAPVMATANAPTVQVLAGFQNAEGQTFFLRPLRSFENAYWTELFDSTPEIREVVPVLDNSVRGNQTTMQQLRTSAMRLNTELLLVYGFDNTSTPESCTVSGVLLEVVTGQTIATLQRTRHLDDAVRAAAELPEWSRPEEEDLSFYLDHITFRAFEEAFKECIWTLIDRDGGPTGGERNPYKDAKPPYVRDRRGWQ
jgi:hypothetical protein